MYKCIEDISEPEEWTEAHWSVDENKPFPDLKALPMTVTAFSASESAEISFIIERAQDYFIDRPDGGQYGGYSGETVMQKVSENNEALTIEQTDISGYLDDDALYYLIIRAVDDYGQVAEERCLFRVKWTHQALIPSASVQADNQNKIVKITINTPNLPDGTTSEDIEGDVCDIYRFNAEGIDLIYSGATFGETYVDPYPTIGDHGGHRIVYRTKNGDYIAEETINDTVVQSFAWIDLTDDEDDYIESSSHIIDFGNDTVDLMYNVDINNSWSKDFQETHYLGGSIQGDWNIGVSRNTSINANVLTSDWDVIFSLRNLATYEGVCHVRTRDGSNYYANIDVSEKTPYEVYYDSEGIKTKIIEYSLSITAVDSMELDGMTLEAWNNSNGIVTPEIEEQGPQGATGNT